MVADVLGHRGRGKTHGPGGYGFAQQGLDPARLLGRGSPLHRLFAHDVVPERGEGGQESQINPRAALPRRVHVLGKTLPLPRDTFGEDIDGNRLHVDQVPGGNLSRPRPARGQTYATIPHDDRGDAVPGRARDQRIPTDLRVVVRVGIDEPGGDDQVPGVDDLLRPVGDFADLGNLAAADGDIRAVAWRAGAVNDRAILDE